MDWIALISIFFSLILIALLYGIEIAYATTNKLSLELKKKQKSVSGKTWNKFSDNPTRLFGTVLVGANVLLAIYGLLIGDMLLPVWNWIKQMLEKYEQTSSYVDYIRLLVETILSATIILFVRFMSKAFFKSKSAFIINSTFISYFANFFYWLFSSISSFFVSISEWILKYIFNVKINTKRETFNRIDIEHYINQNKKLEIEESSEVNKELFEKALNLGEIKIRTCLIPRKEVEAIESNSSIESIRNKFIESKLSKIVVFENNIDNIVGYVHHLDLFKNPQSLKEIIHPIPTVPETMSATDLMNKFSKERKSIAWVVDEFGGTAGIVTMEDLLEEIFGEIEDEYDVPEVFVEKQLAEDEYIFSGRLELDFIQHKYEINFPDSEGIETLSGYIINHHETIPKLKDRIIIGNFEFDILNVSDTRIETVKIKVLK